MPFLWTTIETKGKLIGNRDLLSHMNVTNQMWFSYPGYNELLSGQADDVRWATGNVDRGRDTRWQRVIVIHAHRRWVSVTRVKERDVFSRGITHGKV